MSSERYDRVTWAQTVRDIVINAMNRGQLLPLFILAIFLCIFIRVPDDALVLFLRWVVLKLAKFELVGYIISVVLAAGWYIHAKALRKKGSAFINQMRSGNKIKKKVKR